MARAYATPPHAPGWEAQRAGFLSVVALALGTIIPFIIGALMAAAFGYTDAVGITTIGSTRESAVSLAPQYSTLRSGRSGDETGRVARPSPKHGSGRLDG